jgi:DNA (cytosine-5)-methyltransferase 1
MNKGNENGMVNQQSLNELALFAGAGGGILGGHLLGWRTVCAVEWEQYPASVLCARQNDGFLPPFPIWDDIQTFDGKPWRGIVDVVSGGFPCQDISSAGKGAGIDGERSGMWGEMARVIHEVQPKFVFVENSPMLTSRGLGRVLGDLATMGFDANWGVLGANDIGANHQRDRIWIVGKQMGYTYNDGQIATEICKSIEQRSDKNETRSEQTRKPERSSQQYAELAHTTQLFSDVVNNHPRIGMERKAQSQFGNSSGQNDVSNANLPQQQGRGLPGRIQKKDPFTCDARWWQTEPNVGRVAHGVALGVDRLKAIGNGQVPLCAATAWRILNEGFANK